jgi:lipopolysaccharide/colanic/teichoic acid biosynthesis glycosyltransferase
MLKRLFDIAASTAALIVFGPLLIALTIWVRLDSPGPAFYRGQRIGQHGKPFGMLKFRSMVVNADAIGPSSTSSDDTRITKCGRFLRRSKLDELPQFINVLKGEMSIVGPRPQVSWAVEQYDEEEKRILLVKPGISDWATLQVGDEGERLRGSDDPDRDYLQLIWPEKRRLQLEYVDHHSMWTDLRIVFFTFRAMTVDKLLRKES